MHLLVFPIGAAAAALLYLIRVPAFYPLIVIFGALVIQTRFSTGRTQNYLLALTTIVAAANVMEILGMILAPQSQQIRESVEDGLWDPRLLVGWGPRHPGTFRASRTLNGRKIYDVTYTIDSNLNRQTLAGEGGKGIAIFGDSFMFGEGLEDDQTLPQQLANLQQRIPYIILRSPPIIQLTLWLSCRL